MGRGRGRGSGRRHHGTSRGSKCDQDDPARLSGTRCDLQNPGACAVVYAILRMANGKYLAPGEHGLIGASAAADERGGVPLDSVAWRVQEVSGSWDHSGWVRLQHLLSGKYLRLVVPPDPMEWTFTVEREPEPHGKQTWFQIECSREPCSGGSVHVRVHPEATGAHINYRGADLVRGHGDRQPWMPSSQSASSLVRLETFGLARLASDMAKWAPRRRACLAPCEEAADAVLGEGGSWDEVCASVYAEPFCAAMVRVHGTRPAVTWGSAPAPARMRWARLGCQNYLSTQDVNALAGLDVSRSVAQVPPPRRVPAAAPTRSGGGVSTDEARMHCVQPTDGVLLLLVSDRPNQFLCHYFAAAMVRAHTIPLSFVAFGSALVRMVRRNPHAHRSGSAGAASGGVQRGPAETHPV
eukprot:scaffold5808_cov128-Isochrysis_galbana.AAC.5